MLLSRTSKARTEPVISDLSSKDDLSGKIGIYADLFREEQLYHFSWGLCFADSTVQQKLIDDDRESYRFSIVIELISSIFYYFLSLISFWKYLSVDPKGTLIYVCTGILGWIIAVLCILFLSCLSSKFYQFLFKKKFSLFFVCYHYPVILARCIAFIYIIHENNETSDFFYIEVASFYAYIFLAQTLFMMTARISFVLAMPTYVMGSLALLICCTFQRGLDTVIPNVLLLLSSLAFFSAFYFFRRATLFQFSIKLLCGRLVSQAKERLVDQHRLSVVCEVEQTKAKSLVFGQLAHDIGSPLSALSMGVELLEEQANRKNHSRTAALAEELAEQREAFDAMHASIASIVVLRQSMLDYVRKAGGALLKPSIEPVDIKRLVVQKAYTLLRQLLRPKGKVKAMWTIDPRLLDKKFYSAESWLLDMLLNYISNAVKFTEKGTIEIIARLKEGTAENPYLVMFEVVDSGRGVNNEQSNKLFEAFSQLQENKGGTGLGLCSVKQKANILGGEAGFYNNLNKEGTTFYFTVPLRPANSRVDSSLSRSLSAYYSGQGSAHMQSRSGSFHASPARRSSSSSKYRQAVALTTSSSKFVRVRTSNSRRNESSLSSNFKLRRQRTSSSFQSDHRSVLVQKQHEEYVSIQVKKQLKLPPRLAVKKKDSCTMGKESETKASRTKGPGDLLYTMGIYRAKRSVLASASKETVKNYADEAMFASIDESKRSHSDSKAKSGRSSRGTSLKGLNCGDSSNGALYCTGGSTKCDRKTKNSLFSSLARFSNLSSSDRSAGFRLSVTKKSMSKSRSLRNTFVPETRCQQPALPTRCSPTKSNGTYFFNNEGRRSNSIEADAESEAAPPKAGRRSSISTRVRLKSNSNEYQILDAKEDSPAFELAGAVSNSSQKAFLNSPRTCKQGSARSRFEPPTPRSRFEPPTPTPRSTRKTSQRESPMASARYKRVAQRSSVHSENSSPSFRVAGEKNYWSFLPERPSDYPQSFPAASAKELCNLVVMVVDDTTILLNLYTRMLQRATIKTIIQAESGEQCLDVMFGPDPTSVDMIFMDDRMTGLRGPQAVQEILKQCHAHRIPLPAIYLCTGSSPQQIREEFPHIDLMVEGIIQKPLTFEDLRKILQSKAYNDCEALSVHEEEINSEKNRPEPKLATRSKGSLFELNVGSILSNQLQFEHLKKELDEIEEIYHERSSKYSGLLSTGESFFGPHRKKEPVCT